MSTVRDFFVAMPGLCGAKNAARWSAVNAMVFDLELEDGSIFDRNEDDLADPDNRLECLFGFFGEPGAKEQCRRLARILMYSHYLDEHGEKEYARLIDIEYEAAAAVEDKYPDIKAVLAVDDAVTMARWS